MLYSLSLIPRDEKHMPLIDPNHPLADLLERDQRYSLDAYCSFLKPFLCFKSRSVWASGRNQMTTVSCEKKESEKHVSGQDL